MPAAASCAHSLESPLRTRRPRLHHPGQLVVERRDRQHHQRGAVGCQLTKQIDVARHGMALRDDADRIPELDEHLEARARELQPPLDRLIRIGDATEADALRRPRLRQELLAQERRGVLLHENLALEVHARRQAEVLVIRPRVAVDAAVLAAAVRVEIHGHPDVRAVVVAQDAFRGVPKELRRSRRTIVIVIHALRHDGQPLEASGGIPRRAAAALDDRLLDGLGHASQCTAQPVTEWVTTP